MFVQILEKKNLKNLRQTLRLSVTASVQEHPTTVSPQCIENTFWDYTEYFYTICIGSFILGELKPFRNFKSFLYYCPDNFRCNLAHYESEKFFVPLSITLLHPKISGFLCPSKNSLALGVKCEKLELQKIIRNLLDKLWTLHMNGTVIQKCLAILK